MYGQIKTKTLEFGYGWTLTGAYRDLKKKILKKGYRIEFWAPTIGNFVHGWFEVEIWNS